MSAPVSSTPGQCRQTSPQIRQTAPQHGQPSSGQNRPMLAESRPGSANTRLSVYRTRPNGEESLQILRSHGPMAPRTVRRLWSPNAGFIQAIMYRFRRNLARNLCSTPHNAKTTQCRRAPKVGCRPAGLFGRGATPHPTRSPRKIQERRRQKTTTTTCVCKRRWLHKRVTSCLPPPPAATNLCRRARRVVLCRGTNFLGILGGDSVNMGPKSEGGPPEI